MKRELTDSAGDPVMIETFGPDGGHAASYRLTSEDGTVLGRADFIDSEESEHERVFFHTEVDHAYSGRGLAGLILSEALADSILERVIVVPVCPLFARHLRDHGEEFRAAGGEFRKPISADIAAVRRMADRRGSRE